MPIFDQGYRGYEGELRRESPWLSIAWHNFRTRLNRATWIVLLFAWAPAVFNAILIYTTTSTRVGAIGAGATPMTTLAYRATGANALNLTAAVKTLTSGSSYLFWNFLETQTLFVLLVPAVACSGILGDDRRTGALQVYFSRPVSRADYLIGKVATVSAFVLAVTWVPAMLLWLESVLFAPSFSEALGTILAPVSITVTSLLFCFYASGICLAFSSLFSRRGLAGIAIMVFFGVSTALARILTQALKADEWRQLSPDFALGGISAPFFGLDVPQWLESPSLLASCIALPAAGLMWAWVRIRAVEVAT